MNGEPTGKEFMGRGWAFPFRVEPASGRISTVADEADIEESIRIILGTSKGERVMRPAFGCGVYDLVHGAIDMATIVQIKRDVAEALQLYEARIDVLAVKVDPSNLINGCLEVEVDYRVRQTNQRDNYVFPFYFKEAR
jgi:phage baseplate assembly protein W